MPTTRSFWSAAGERLHGLHSFLKYIMPTYSATNVMAVTCIQAKAAIIGKEKAKIRKRFPGFCDYCILTEYEFIIKYRPGRVNESADFLSRLGY